jgi:hypothetical protein
MGVTKETLDHLNRVILNYGKPTNELSLLELGIQEILFPNKDRYLQNHLKNKFENYISLDLHTVPGVTIFDLSVYNPKSYSVDIITNFGTTEHVEYEEGQYNCWLNIHSWLNLGGLSIHQIPEFGSWPKHCRFYTNFDFYLNLKSFGYEVVELDNHSSENGNLNWCVLKKVEDVPFMDYETFYKYMIVDNSVTISSINPLNNPKNLK